MRTTRPEPSPPPPPPSPARLVEPVLGIAALAALTAACALVLLPFLSALLLAGILCYATWPVYERLERAVNGRRTLAASLMTLSVTLILIAPFAVVAATLADNVRSLSHQLQVLVDQGLPPAPLWMRAAPVIGDWIADYWNGLAASGVGLVDQLRGFAAPAGEMALRIGAVVGRGLLDLCLAVFTAFFFYRSGRSAAHQLALAVERLAGPRAHHLIAIAGLTVNGVVYGILGTALAQGSLAGLGFWMAGVPGALFLGFVTFVLSMLPAGPPLVWIPATIWLFSQDHIGWGVFMGAWGFLVVSSVDNVLKPWLISRGSDLPLVLVFLGAFGGIIAFGFVGIFLGPTLLAIGYALVREWTAEVAGAGGGSG